MEAQPLLSEHGLPMTPLVHMLRTEIAGAEPEQKTDTASSRLTAKDECNNCLGKLTGEVVGLLPAMFPGIQSAAVLQPQVLVLRHNPEAQCELCAEVHEPP